MHDSRGIEIVNFTISLALSAGTLMTSAGTPYRLVPAAHFYPCAELSKVSKGSPYSITERRVPELIPVLGSQPAGDVSHKPCGRLPLLSATPAVTPATLKKAAANFAAW